MKSNSHYTSDIDHCGIISLPRHEDPYGQLTEVQNTRGAKMVIRRVFYLYDVPANSERGGHSHYDEELIIVAVSGSFSVTLHDGHRQRTYFLSRPYQGLYVEKGIWNTLQDFSAGSVCLVLTTGKYDESDYVRDFDQFMALTRQKEYHQGTVKYPFLDLGEVNRRYIEEVKRRVMSVIDSGYYIGGSEVERLEQHLCRLTSAPYAVGVSNGLDALRLIFRAYIELGRLSPGDEVIVPANTYIASILAVTDMGLTPIFVEPDPATMNLDTALIEQHITPRTRAILTVHLYGRVCYDRRLRDLANAHSLIVVEDNAQAIGAVSTEPGNHGSRAAGALGDAGAFSFYPTKNIGAMGDAGAVVTHDKALADTVAALRNYGSDRRYHNIYAGYNCRLDPMQAAIIDVKLSHIDEEIHHRQALADIYDNCITNPKVTKPLNEGDGRCVWHQYVVRVDERDRFREYLRQHGVATDVHYATPPHQQPCYSRYSQLSLPITCQIASTVVSLPISRCTSLSDARAIADIINKYE